MVNQADLNITTELLIKALEAVYEGLNENQKVKIGDVVIDIPKIIKNEKINPVKKVQVKGRFL